MWKKKQHSFLNAMLATCYPTNIFWFNTFLYYKIKSDMLSSEMSILFQSVEF